MALPPDLLDALHAMGFSRAHVHNPDQYTWPQVEYVLAVEDDAATLTVEGASIFVTLIAQNQSFLVTLDRELPVPTLIAIIRTTLDTHRVVSGS
jgi:hypothetical protein